MSDYRGCWIIKYYLVVSNMVIVPRIGMSNYRGCWIIKYYLVVSYMVIVPRVCTYVRLQRLLDYQVLLSSGKHGDCPQSMYACQIRDCKCCITEMWDYRCFTTIETLKNPH